MPRPLFVLVLALGAWAFGEDKEAGGAQQNGFVRIWPEKPVVEYGHFLVLNCSSNCDKIRLETSLNYVVIQEEPAWKTFNFTSVTEWKPKPLCYSTCEEKSSKPERASITVYKSPEHVKLDPVPKIEVGKEYNLTCRVSSVAPIQNLSVIFLKGEEELQVKTFENHVDHKPSPVTVSHTLIPQEGDYGEEITCRAVLDLRPAGPRIEKASPSQNLSTVVFQTDPYIQSLNSIEINVNLPVECNVKEIFPAEEAEFSLSFAGQNLTLKKVTLSKNSASAYTEVSSTIAGKHQLICTVSLGPVTRTVKKTVNVYSLPKPVLDVKPSKIIANETITLACLSDGTQSPGTIMVLRDSGRVLKSGDESTLNHSLTAREEDDGKQFTCRLILNVEGQPVTKETSANLTVFYPPRMDDTNCPRQLTWKDGSRETFICSAWGNPKPTVECTKDEKSYKDGEVLEVKQKHEGVYHCNATNAYGSEIREIIIRVESYQLNWLAIGLGILLAVTVVSLVGVSYYLNYRNKKTGKYHLKRNRQAGGIPMEEKCLNGSAKV